MSLIEINFDRNTILRPTWILEDESGSKTTVYGLAGSPVCEPHDDNYVLNTAKIYAPPDTLTNDEYSNYVRKLIDHHLQTNEHFTYIDTSGDTRIHYRSSSPFIIEQSCNCAYCKPYLYRHESHVINLIETYCDTIKCDVINVPTVNETPTKVVIEEIDEFTIYFVSFIPIVRQVIYETYSQRRAIILLDKDLNLHVVKVTPELYSKLEKRYLSGNKTIRIKRSRVLRRAFLYSYNFSFSETMCNMSNSYDGIFSYQKVNPEMFCVGTAIDNKDKLAYITEDKLKYFVGIDNEIDFIGVQRSRGVMARPTRTLLKAFPGMSKENAETLCLKYFTLPDIKNFDFKIVSGDDITKYYSKETYARGDGTLNSSCMRYEDCSSYFGVYEDNCKMLVLFNKEYKVVGRALLWDDVHFEHLDSDKTFMDRIYTIDNNFYEQLFIDYADEHDYVRKRRQSYNDKDSFVYKNDSFDEEIEIELVKNCSNYNCMPYIDTLTYSYDGITLNNHGGDYSFEDTDGGNPLDHINRVYSSYHGEYIDEDNAVYSESMDDYIYECDSVRLANGEYTLESRATQCHDGEWNLSEEVVELVCGEYAHADDDDIVYLTAGQHEDEYCICNDVVMCGDDYYHTDDVGDTIKYNEIEGEYQLIVEEETVEQEA